MAKAKLTFMGGIHPYDGKDLSKDKPMKAVLPKGDLVYPLSQHIGARQANRGKGGPCAGRAEDSGSGGLRIRIGILYRIGNGEVH